MSDIKVKTLADIYAEGLKYVQGRKEGRITSVKTPWIKINKAGVNGFEWGSIITIAGRPGSGKTTFVNSFTRAAHAYNPRSTFDVIDLQFEMADKMTAVRDFVTATGVKYDDILSADRPLGDDVLEEIQRHIRLTAHRDILTVTQPLTVSQIKAFLFSRWEKTKIPMIVTLDHSMLVKIDKGEKDKFEMLGNLGEMLTEVKKHMDVIFFILTQMNRGIEDQSRRVPGTLGNYPVTSDIFGADALLQHSDMMIALINPFKNNLREYGPDKFVLTQNMMAVHFLKSRNGDNDLVFMDFDPVTSTYNDQVMPQRGGPGPAPSGGGLSTRPQVTPFARRP